jgi:glucose-1-phosphate cytidylyltransferase
MKAVILAGGMGTRLREETEFRPKPMVEIGGRPILWHIMKYLSRFGINEFIICIGYKGDYIKEYFTNYQTLSHDVTVKLGDKSGITRHDVDSKENWKVTIADTGLLTMTGGRLKKVKRYLDGETFLCTYGDGLANVDINALIAFHSSHGKIATVTGVRPTTRFGAMELDEDFTVRKFSEKPKSDTWVNGGYFIFENEIFDYLEHDSILEKVPLEGLAKNCELKAYKHEGFWQPMDTYRETLELNDLWDQNDAPLRVW